ncbi:Tm-1-like ATP-binding domain-containing protein [Shumkonia mesophila]|uniref:Tm-1-like ATP-binding domain-containing protein n=1 Tax=Shumkonia mesophila TaxID=2838854 RepID=UPI00293469D7|nr:Tm-1-like ATP-binding domain-containing protein [Shumkonia mesophila]
MKTVAIVGTLDTKGAEFAFLKSEIERHGCKTLVFDAGVSGTPAFPPDVDAAEICSEGKDSLPALHHLDRGTALDAMARMLPAVVKRYFDEGRFDGIVSMGGGGGTALGTSAMRALPIGVPKVMVSTIASADTSPYVGTSDIIMMPSIVDVAGLNRISRTIFANAAAAICGMVKGRLESPPQAGDRPLIAASMFGNTTRAVDHARGLLEARGFEVLVFHATGTGGRTMERLIGEGYFAGVLDLTTTEWADEICGGALSAGPTRLEAAGRAGIPQVVTPACIDMCNFWAPETVPARYAGRTLHHWNPNVTLMRTTPEENASMGRIFAEKLSAARGPVVVLVPLKGFSELDAPGKPFWWPEADRAFVDALRADLRPDIPVLPMDYNVNDAEFSEEAANTLLRMMEKGKQNGHHTNGNPAETA